MLVVEYVPESVVDHGVDDGLVVHPVSPSGTVHDVGGVAHALHTSDGKDVVLAGLDGIGCKHDGFECGTADGVDGERTDLHGESCSDGGLPCRVLSETCGEDVTHYALLYIRGLYPGPLDRFLDDVCTEVGGLYAVEGLSVFSDRCPACAYDYCLFHGEPF